MDYPDQRALIYGQIGRNDGTAIHYGLYRLDANGNLESAFNPPIQGLGDIRSVCLLSTGKILIAGSFTISSGNSTYVNLARLNDDGSVDTSFASTISIYGSNDTGMSSGPVNAIAVQSDGKILVGGYCMGLMGDFYHSYYLFRLLEDGTLDPSYPMRSAPTGYVSSIEILKDDPFNPDRARIYGTLPDPSAAPFPKTYYLLNLYSNGNKQSYIGDETVDGPICAMVTQPDGKMVIGGQFTQVLGVPRKRVARLKADLSLDSDFYPWTGADGGKVTSLVLQQSGKIVVAGNFTSFNSAACGFIVRLNPDGSVDGTLSSGTGAGDYIISMTTGGSGLMIYGAFRWYNGVTRNGIASLTNDGILGGQYTGFISGYYFGCSVYAQAVQADGKILVGGDFTSAGGMFHHGIARLNPNGSVDGSFRAGVDGTVRSIALQPDGKILVAGIFGAANSCGRASVARLNPDGSLDVSFNPLINTKDGSYSGLNSDYVCSLGKVVRLSTGKILVAGNLVAVNGHPRLGLARLNSDGTLDSAFAPNIQLSNGDPYFISDVVDNAGNYLVVGCGSIQSHYPRGFLVRLTNTGAMDSTFGPTDPSTPSPHADVFNWRVRDLLLQPDGRIMVCGDFTQIMDGSDSPPPRAYLARFTADGILDATFTTKPGASDWIYAMALQSDGKLLIGGNFTSYDSLPRNHIARVNSNGSLDTTFYPGTGTSWSIYNILPTDNKKALIGGNFYNYNGTNLTSVARIFTSGGFSAANFLLLNSD